MLPEKEYTFYEWADIWYENHKENVKPTTQDNYRYTLRILKDGFNRRELKDILCSMPPAQSQFLQRAGRAGRKDGNALTLAVANAIAS